MKDFHLYCIQIQIVDLLKENILLCLAIFIIEKFNFFSSLIYMKRHSEYINIRTHSNRHQFL